MFSTHHRAVRFLVAGAAATATVLAVSACTSSSSPAPTPSVSVDANDGPHNAADVTFAQEMIPHHEQAIEMAALVPERSTNPELLELAQQIEDAQGPEIAQLQSWLVQWGAEVPTAGGHGGHGGDPAEHGMMTDEQMNELTDARGGDFERMWLEMMIAHHEGAVVMAEIELAEGENPQARTMAQQIIDGQTAEIEQMRRMLG